MLKKLTTLRDLWQARLTWSKNYCKSELGNDFHKSEWEVEEQHIRELTVVIKHLKRKGIE